MSKGSGLVRHSKQRTESIQEAIRCTKETIAREIEQHGGTYPYNGGRLSEAEFCRRAGISQITLLGKAHKASSKVELASWLTNVKAGFNKGKRNVSKTAPFQVEAWKGRYEEIANQYHLAELEMIALRHRISDLEAQASEQTAIIARLQSELNARQVVKFRQRTGP